MRLDYAWLSIVIFADIMLDHHLLPTEIWLEILDWATTSHEPLAMNIPFSPLPDYRVDPNLRVRATLTAVCRTWQRWVAQSLYKDIKISNNGAHGLMDVLQKCPDQTETKYGEMVGSFVFWRNMSAWTRSSSLQVRRIVLPYQSTGPSRALQSLEILKLCPNIQTLQRPLHPITDTLRFDYDTDIVTLSSLERLEWWHHNEAERSGGINSLGVVLRSAPRLRYLFIGGVVSGDYICMLPGPTNLSFLETIRLCVRSGSLLRQIVSRWSLPSLTHVILDSPLVREGSEIIWETFGDQLKVVEFGKHVRFLASDSLSSCLRSCPNLQELNFYVFFASPLDAAFHHPKLTSVGLHAHVNGMLVEGGSAWNLIEHHFEVLYGSNLPALKQIMLHGDWRPILNHHRFRGIKEKLLGSRRSLEIWNKTGIVSLMDGSQ